MPTIIRTMPTGPYIIEGDVEIYGADGQKKTPAGRIALCRCGASKNKPFCDGQHKAIGFCETLAAQQPNP